MSTDLPIRCFCGSFEALLSGVSPAVGNHVVCHCDDCQVYQHVLRQSERVLDAHGGTAIFQLSPARLRLTSGRSRLACLRLRPGGLLRWYADCCNTPLGNTLATRAIPFVGIVVACLETSGDEASVARALGPSKGVHGRHAIGKRNDLEVHATAPPSMLLRLAGKFIGWRLCGDHRRSPLFDAATGRPVVVPRVLSDAELASAGRRCQALSGGRSPS